MITYTQHGVVNTLYFPEHILYIRSYYNHMCIQYQTPLR